MVICLTISSRRAKVLDLPMVTTLLAAVSVLSGDEDEPLGAQVVMLADTFG